MHPPFNRGWRRGVSAFLLIFVLTACATQPDVRPAPNGDTGPTAAPTADPTDASPPGPDAEFVAAAIDLTTDPEPPGGRPDVTAIGDETLFLESAAYDVVYSETKRNPLVVAYFLRPHSSQDFEPCERPDDFIRDDRTTTRVTDADFTNTGHDRGHMAPNNTIATRHGCDAQRETFLLTNIAPQRPGLNQRTWASFEIVVDSTYADEFEGVWVLTGPVFDPEEIVTLCHTEIEVPREFWKIVIRRTPVDNALDVAAVVMQQTERDDDPIGTYTTTIDDLERRTGIDFFPDLPPSEEQALESTCPGNAWHLDQRLVPPHPGGTRPICVDPSTPRAQSLGTEVGHDPLCAP